MIVTEEKLSKALNYLAENDKIAADLKVEVSRKEYLCKVARAKIFTSIEGSVAERNAVIDMGQAFEIAENERLEAMSEYETVKAKRETAVLIIDVWRSENANRRQGNIT